MTLSDYLMEQMDERRKLAFELLEAARRNKNIDDFGTRNLTALVELQKIAMMIFNEEITEIGDVSCLAKHMPRR